MNLLQMPHRHDHFWPPRLWRVLEAKNIISRCTLWHIWFIPQRQFCLPRTDISSSRTKTEVFLCLLRIYLLKPLYYNIVLFSLFFPVCSILIWFKNVYFLEISQITRYVSLHNFVLTVFSRQNATISQILMLQNILFSLSL